MYVYEAAEACSLGFVAASFTATLRTQIMTVKQLGGTKNFYEQVTAAGGAAESVRMQSRIS